MHVVLNALQPQNNGGCFAQRHATSGGAIPLRTAPEEPDYRKTG